jgi:hypothetical protein
VPLASPQLVRFWTEMLPERERFSAFREEFARQVLRMDVADLSERNPHFDLTYLNLGQIAVGSLVGTASEFVRNTHHVKDGFGAFSVGVVAAGPVLARHAGQEHCLSVGSGLFFDHSRPQHCPAERRESEERLFPRGRAESSGRQPRGSGQSSRSPRTCHGPP